MIQYNRPKILSFSRRKFYELYKDQLTDYQVENLYKTVFLLCDCFKLYDSERDIEIICKSGFVFDGASVPSVFRWFIDRAQQVLQSLPHDLVYIFKGLISNIIKSELSNEIYFNRNIKRKEVDKLYRDISKQEETNNTNISFLGIRLGGWVLWNKKFHTNKIIFVDVLEKHIK